MADEPTIDAPDAPTEGDENEGMFDAERAKAKIAKANSEAANLRKRLKELEPLAAKAQEIENASKTEAEKFAERLTAAEQRAQEAELKALRLEVASAKGLTPAQARRLVGSSLEELEADADDLLASFTPTDTPDRGLPVTRPTERLRAGGTGQPAPKSTADQFAAAIDGLLGG